MDNSPRKVLINRIAWTKRLQRVVMGKGTLHELGHTLGIVPAAHPGIDNMPQGNYQWPETLTDEEWEKVNVEYKSIMNYNYVFPYGLNFMEDFSFFDFSDGTNGEFDFNDLTHFYLPTFQMDASILESPQIRYGTFDDFEWIDKDPDPIYDGWVYEKNLTEKFKQDFSALRFDIDNAVEYNYRVYIKTDETEQGRGIRIYAKPNVKPIPSLWSLIAECHFEENDNDFEFYSFQQIYNELLQYI
jgi:hypothetical protein